MMKVRVLRKVFQFVLDIVCVFIDEDTEDEDDYQMKEVLKSGPKGEEIVIDLTDTKAKGEVKNVVARCVRQHIVWLHLCLTSKVFQAQSL